MTTSSRQFWHGLFRRPDCVADEAVRDAWFCRVADALLRRARLVVAGQGFRLLEVEIYRRADDQPDPFAHAEPAQLHPGRWYFHQTAGHYRGGSYKGLDITFGDGRSYGGILIRSVEDAAGRIINGPSLLVDRILSLTSIATVAALDRAIGPAIWNPRSPVFLALNPDALKVEIYRSARVGLSLKRVAPTTDNLRHLLRPDRFVVEPARIRKGRLHVTLAMMRRGESDQRIAAATGVAAIALRRYREQFEIGRRLDSVGDFAGRLIDWRRLCLLHGFSRRD